MGIIKLLDDLTINKIAAGEVVERPASVVKELVENSIDAGANSITVEIKQGGKKYIRITDDGCGFEKDDIPLAFLRHSTSKIKTSEDLNHIMSLGFRGEALASISAVSHTTLITKSENSDGGMQVEVHGGKMFDMSEVGCPKGTTIIVKNLFFNTPVRQKFLRANSTESSYIGDIVNKLALSYPNISFKFIRDDKVIVKTPGKGNLKATIYSIFGKDFSKSIYDFEFEKYDIKLSGFLGSNNFYRGNRSYQFFFINGRFITSKLLSRSLEKAYESLLPINKFPVGVIFISMNAEDVDVNVHPTKLEVRFKNTKIMSDLIFEATKKCLVDKNLIPEVGIGKSKSDNKSVQEAFIDLKTTKAVLNMDFSDKKDYTKIPFEEKIKAEHEPLLNTIKNKEELKQNDEPDIDIPQIDYSNYVSDEDLKDLDFMIGTKNHPKSEKTLVEAVKVIDEIEVKGISKNSDFKKESKKDFKEEKSSDFNEIPPIESVSEPRANYNFEEKRTSLPEIKFEKRLPDLKLIGNLFTTYIIAEDVINQNMYMIDQHAAHERINYEKFRTQFENQKITTQNLLVPEVINLSNSEIELFKENIDMFKKMGFDVEPFGEDALIIRGVPLIFGEPDVKNLFMDIMDSLNQNLNSAYELRLEKIMKLACTNSIKSGFNISSLEAIKLLEDLALTNNPYTCPHGRPTIIKITKSEIEKKFKRIQ